ncbi:MAG TPA: glycine cleavage T C-terminal barrel domain-containing protein [Acidimicrobiales bacterium]|nr:glycine cleavage T C-terminal barrel domain-containing protein [Acidimicrobiales bacterium]
MSTSDEAYDAVWAGEPVELDRDVVEVRGPDAAAYLQGQLSQDVAALPVGDVVVTSLLLEPDGKLGFVVGVARVGGVRFLVTVDRPSGAAVAARLERFKLRTDAAVRATSGEWHVVATLDRDTPAFVERVLAEGPGLDAARTAARDVVRIELGVPSMATEVRDELIPAELGQSLIDAAVSFTKGCYTGQELVARVDSRGGNVPRRLRGVVVGGDERLAPGDELVADGRVVGTVTTAGWSPRLAAPVALALVHRSVEVPAAVSVRGSIDAEVRALPLSAGSATAAS